MRKLEYAELEPQLEPSPGDDDLRRAFMDGHLEAWEQDDGEVVVLMTELGKAFAVANAPYEGDGA